VSDPREESPPDPLESTDAAANGAGPAFVGADRIAPPRSSSPLDRPEVAVGAAFAGGLLLAILLKKGGR
jgi:hypothetical protein